MTDTQAHALTLLLHLALLLQLALMGSAWLAGAVWGYCQGLRVGHQQGQRWAARASGLGELTETARAVHEQEGAE